MNCSPKAENIMENISNATLKHITSNQQKACFQSQEALFPVGRSKASVGWKEKKIRTRINTCVFFYYLNVYRYQSSQPMAEAPSTAADEPSSPLTRNLALPLNILSTWLL